MIGKNAEWKYFRKVSLSLSEKMGDWLISMQKWSQSVKSSTSVELIQIEGSSLGVSCPVSPFLAEEVLLKVRIRVQAQGSESLDLPGTGARNMWVMGLQRRREPELLCLSWLGGLWSLEAVEAVPALGWWTRGAAECGMLCDHFLGRRLCVCIEAQPPW